MLGEYHTQKQALSRFFVGAMLQTEPVLDVIRRELRRVSPDVRIDSEQIKSVLINEVIKREARRPLSDADCCSTTKHRLTLSG